MERRILNYTPALVAHESPGAARTRYSDCHRVSPDSPQGGSYRTHIAVFDSCGVYQALTKHIYMTHLGRVVLGKLHHNPVLSPFPVGVLLPWVATSHVMVTSHSIKSAHVTWSSNDVSTRHAVITSKAV